MARRRRRRTARRTTRNVAIGAAIFVSTLGYFMIRDSGPARVASELPKAAKNANGIPLAGLPETGADDPGPAAAENLPKKDLPQNPPPRVESDPDRLARCEPV